MTVRRRPLSLFSPLRTKRNASTTTAPTTTPETSTPPRVRTRDPRGPPTLPINLYVKSSRNNTIISLVSTLSPQILNKHSLPLSGVLSRISGGTAGFKKVHRSGYEAGYQCAVRSFAQLVKLDEENVEQGGGGVDVTLLFNGFGQGREAVTRALLSPDGEAVRGMFVRVTDRTPIPIGGVRPKKKRTL